MSPSKGTPPRAIRVDPGLWASARAEAERRGESLSEAIRRFLEGYVKGDASSDGK